MFEIIVAAIIAFSSMFIPGFFLALALLRKTGISIMELMVIAVIFGLIAPAGLTWLEAYLIPVSSFFSFSIGLFNINVVILSIIGIVACWYQGVFKNFKAEITQRETAPHLKEWIWIAMLVLMLLTFISRMQSIYTAPTFFEFDPYFDMMDAEYILTYGQQLLNDPSAWPVAPAGTNHRLQPIVPYLEAYWYQLYTGVSGNSAAATQSFSTSIMSYVGGVYPPITAALLVFLVFMILYREYDPYLGLLGAGLTATMPVLFTTFIAGEQLVEPWGIFALFFFIAAYMLAVKNPKSMRLAVFAGIAFASNFLGAHYYTVTAGVLAAYILIQGIIDVIRGDSKLDFYKMNAVVIAVIAIFLTLYSPYGATLTERTPAILGIPIVVALPLFSLLLVAVMDYIPKFMNQRKIIFQKLGFTERAAFAVLIIASAAAVVLFTPAGGSLRNYIDLSIRFTTPSSPLFMTVEEYIPTGLMYNFGASGFGFIGAGISGVPILVWIICALGLLLLTIAIFYRRNNSAIMYMATALPLMAAGFSEVKYLPHFGVAYIILFIAILGELIVLSEHGLGTLKMSRAEIQQEQKGSEMSEEEKKEGSKTKLYRYVIYAIGMFFLSAMLSMLFLLYAIFTNRVGKKSMYLWGIFALLIVIEVVSIIGAGGLSGLITGEGQAFTESFTALAASAGTPAAQLCQTLSGQGNALGYSIYCNVIPQYWLNAMSWIRSNVGPTGTRVLSWWDYGDWINWFGNGNAFLRGDNANAIEDYATAAHFVLGTQDGYSPQSLASFMNGNQSKYVLFDQDLVAKWQALDFLGCVYANQTSQAFAQAAGASQNPPQPFLLGTSQCEIKHDPEFLLVPLAALVPQNQTALQLNMFCNFTTSTQTFIRSYTIIGSNLTNQQVCVSAQQSKASSALQLYDSNGTLINAVIQPSYYQGVINIAQQPFVEFLVIYLPNAKNGTITNAPTGFYTSNFYKGFFLGQLPGFTEVYPSNGIGVNFVNGTYPIRIYQLNNFTGNYPPVPPKPSYINNNFTMP